MAGASHARAQSAGASALKWNEPVRALAENIASAAAAANSSRTMALEVKNVSSLGDADAAAIRQGLEAELGRRGFHVGAAATAETRVEVTLSESAEKYVWVAEIHGEGGDRVAMVDVARQAENLSGKQGDSLALDRKLVWRQPGKFLDFAVFQGFDAASASLWILEPERIAFYLNTGGEWKLEGAATIPHRAAWPRDMRGTIDAARGKIFLPGLECTVKAGPANEALCTPAGAVNPPQIKIDGRAGDDALTLMSACGSDSMVLATGSGDWTQADSIQGYLERNGRAMSSGDPIQTDGPVMALNGDSEGAARAVVDDLKSGNYEGYIVTATCSH